MAGSEGGGGREERRALDGGEDSRPLLGGLTDRGPPVGSVIMATTKSSRPGMNAKLCTWPCSGLSERSRSTTRATVAVPAGSRASGCCSEYKRCRVNGQDPGVARAAGRTPTTAP